MANIKTCDGCGAPEREQLFTKGITIKRDYCPDCLEVARSYEQDRQALMKNAMDRFNKDHAQLIKKMSKENPGFKFPDQT